MVWSTCTILHNKLVAKLKTVTVDVVRKTSMVVRWRLDCSDRVGIVTGYKVVYCPIESHHDTSECINGKIYEQETSEAHATISNLDPWTIYKVLTQELIKSFYTQIQPHSGQKRPLAAHPESCLDLQKMLLTQPFLDRF